jgi:glutamate-1-semialdehyde 2,1-aminomutase
MSGPIDQAWRARAAKVLPASAFGHQSTRLLPAGFPQFFARGAGAYLWDVDGRRYLDFMCAYGPNLLGYGDARVEAAADAQRRQGDVLTGPTPLAVELAEKFTGLVAHADWAFFCKNGTDATTLASTIARAATKRRKVLVAHGAYHGAAPWCTPVPAGVLPEDRAHVVEFEFNDVASLDAAVAKAGDDLAAIFAAPFKHDAFQDQVMPEADYARAARAACDATGALLVVDDVRAGFRLATDCSWSLVGVEPDLSTWGKSFANGHPISALLGNDRARAGADAIYATGSFWQQASPMAAALVTLDIIATGDHIRHTEALGEQLRAGLDAVAARHGFVLKQTGPVQMPQILFADDPDFRVGFAFTEALLAQGVYMHPWHNMFLNAAMTAADMEFAIAAADTALGEVRARLGSLQPHAIVSRMMAPPRAAEPVG